MKSQRTSVNLSKPWETSANLHKTLIKPQQTSPNLGKTLANLDKPLPTQSCSSVLTKTWRWVHKQFSIQIRLSLKKIYVIKWIEQQNDDLVMWSLLKSSLPQVSPELLDQMVYFFCNRCLSTTVTDPGRIIRLACESRQAVLLGDVGWKKGCDDWTNLSITNCM